MLDIKKYSNGKFFDSVNRKYLKVDRIKEYIKKGEKMKVTLTTTGEDVTEEIVAEYSEKSGCVKYNGLVNTDGLSRWVTETIDKRIKQVLDVMNLPTRDQIAELNANIKAIDAKIHSLELNRSEKKEKKEKESDSPVGEKTPTAFEFVENENEPEVLEGKLSGDDPVSEKNALPTPNDSQIARGAGVESKADEGILQTPPGFGSKDEKRSLKEIPSLEEVTSLKEIPSLEEVTSLKEIPSLEDVTGDDANGEIPAPRTNGAVNEGKPKKKNSVEKQRTGPKKNHTKKS